MEKKSNRTVAFAFQPHEQLPPVVARGRPVSDALGCPDRDELLRSSDKKECDLENAKSHRNKSRSRADNGLIQGKCVYTALRVGRCTLAQKLICMRIGRT